VTSASWMPPGAPVWVSGFRPFYLLGSLFAWLHVFTVGSLGMMMIGLMTRVALRHTGRPLVVPHSLRVAYVLILVSPLIRLAADFPGEWSIWLAALAALLWSAGFVIYFLRFARTLVTPSMPRAAPAGYTYEGQPT